METSEGVKNQSLHVNAVERAAETNSDVLYSQRKKKVDAAVDKAIKNKGDLGVKYNQERISEFPADITAVVSAASEGRIDLAGKYIAINGDDIWHEYQSHSDASVEVGRRQLPQTVESIKESVMAIYAPDVVESLFTTNQNPTQRQSFAYAKKSPNGYYIVVEAVGGKKNPNVVPVMLLQFTEEKWNDMMSSGMTLGELLFENDEEKRNSLDVDLNKKNRVTVAQFASKEAIANTPRSPRFKNSIPQSDDYVNTTDEYLNSKKYSTRRRVASDEKTSTRDYSYNALVGKPDMVVTVLGEDVPTNRADIVLQAKKNAAAIGKTDKNGSVSVHVDDIGVDVVLSTGGLRHSLDRRFDVNAPVTLKAGEILHHSIKINEMIPENPNADSSYVLIGIAQNTQGELYVVRSVVNKFRSELVSMDVLYAINAKTEPNLGIKKNQAGAYPQGITEKSAILTGSADMAVLDAPRYTESPLSVTNPKISIAQLLEYVNRYFPDVLPESVLRHFGHTERPQGKIGESALFSTRREGTSARALLEGVDESEITDRDVLSELREYKETLAALDAAEGRPRELLKHGLPLVSRVFTLFFP